MPAASLPDRLVWDRYTLYKTGTKKVVSWLLDTATSIGYGDPKQKPTGPVAVHKMLKCATAIVKSQRVHIPGSMVDLIDEVIRGRQTYADLFSSSRRSTEKPDSSDISHQHFIEALQAIHQTLKEARKKQKAEKDGRNINSMANFATSPATPISPTKPSELTLPREQSLQSLFKHLQVDEPVAQPFSTPEKKKEATVAKAQPTVAIDPIAESRFALLCYPEDMAEIHAFVRDLWEDVVSGKTTADCATQVTENAFGCMRRGTYTLHNTFQGLGRRDVDDAVVGDRAHWHSDKTHLLCLDATLIANTAVEECRAYAAAKKKRGGVYNLGETAVSIAGVHPFAAALFKAIPDLHLVANPNNEYASVFYPHDGKYDMQICAAMMTQSYIDIYEIVGPDKVGELFVDATSRFVKRLEGDIAYRDAVVDQVRNPPSFGRPETLLETLIKQKKFLSQLQAPNLATAKSKVAAEARLAKALPIGAWDQLKFSKWMVRQASAAMANDGWVTLGMAYLYRASRYFGLLSSEWPDMEWLIKLQSQNRSYVIEVAEHADDEAWSRHWRMAFGLPPEYIKRINMNRITDGMRKVESKLLWPKLGEVLARAEEVLGYERGDMAEEVLHQIADLVYAKDAKKQRRGEAKYTSIELLSAFKQAMTHDELQLNFSYAEFWSMNARLLHQLWQFLTPRIPDMLKEEGIGADMEIVHPLLKEAGLSVTASQPLVGTQLAVAARMIEMHVLACGNKFTRDSGLMSSEGAGEGTWMLK
ncbi:hypothetical protein M409DRAFT_24377 [Zasmidium cellare ATCC 36951]|uniref:DUF6604 domain-containing protein n=1 Tax=Zasmidium cellare ATCC 36951 TaxID=1080233 RepID=A0A6A6CE92_ZASCE|nr:uncharacterized protein M409DRAFT_24377 [Zasmidium cellare ATCC 36951]KAF2165524.1 hypothetical protein M409DRAFT_24377 [Zasmidium cellare ATCC 36951]